jgi:cytosine/adenosine deaminase-related metal-dependent hydrolase
MRVAFASGIATESHLIAGEDDAFLAALPADERPYAEQLLPGPERIDENTYFAILDECHQTYRGHERIDIWYAPPGPQWVSDGFMQRIAGQAAKYDCGVQTHVTESFYEKLHGPRSHGRSIVQHLQELGVLSPCFSIAHGVWLSEAEINILADTGAAISHNPSSNLRLRAGIAPLNALLAANVTTALGMDGTTLNDDEDMFTEMRLAMRLHRTPRLHTPAPAPTDIFQMATLGGAKLLRKDTELGRLAPGYLADIVVLDTQRLSWPWIAPESDPRELLLMRARADDVRTVVVGGEVVWNDGQPTRFDLAAAGKEFAEELQKIPYSQQQAELVKRLKPYIESYYAGWEAAPLQPYITYNSKS